MYNKNLVSFRKELGISIADMAERIGVSKSFYEKIEYGERCPSYNFLIKFKTAFPGADTDSIFLPSSNT